MASFPFEGDDDGFDFFSRNVGTAPPMLGTHARNKRRACRDLIESHATNLLPMYYIATKKSSFCLESSIWTATQTSQQGWLRFLQGSGESQLLRHHHPPTQTREIKRKTISSP